MLNLVTGVPGASKTAYVVTQLEKIENNNKVNLERNKIFFEKNKPLFEKYRDDFYYHTREVGSAHELRTVIDVLDEHHFDFLEQDFDFLRPDFYFQRSIQYNEIIERINLREGDTNFKLLLPVRTIYSNINALKIDYTRALIYDWREAPDGSIFVIDEVQLVQPYKDLKTRDPIIMDLTIHRHRGFDFYFITQFPALMHPVVQHIISPHYHITRPYGRTPKIYVFGTIRTHPNSPLNKFNCESKFNFKPQDHIFKLYKSTTINTHKKRMPAGLIPFAIFLLFAVLMFFWGMSDKVEAEKTEQKREQQKKEEQLKKDQQATTLLDANNKAKSKENLTTHDVDDSKKLSSFSPLNDIESKPKINSSACIISNNVCSCYDDTLQKIKVTKNYCKNLGL